MEKKIKNFTETQTIYVTKLPPAAYRPGVVGLSYGDGGACSFNMHFTAYQARELAAHILESANEVNAMPPYQSADTVPASSVDEAVTEA